MIPCIEVGGMLPRQAACFGAMDLWFNANDYAFGNLVLHEEDVG